MEMGVPAVILFLSYSILLRNTTRWFYLELFPPDHVARNHARLHPNARRRLIRAVYCALLQVDRRKEHAWPGFNSARQAPSHFSLLGAMRRVSPKPEQLLGGSTAAVALWG